MNNRNVILRTICQKIDDILENTKMDVLFIPYVYASKKPAGFLYSEMRDYDTTVIDLLYKEYEHNPRVHRIQQFFNAKMLSVRNQEI